MKSFVDSLGPRGLQDQLSTACEEATRTVARTLQHTEVYGLRTDTSGRKAKVITGGDEAEGPTGYEEEGDASLTAVGGPADDERASAALAKGSSVADDMRRSLNDTFMSQGVEITDVIITDVDLPPVIVRQMSEKTTVIASNAAQKMNQECASHPAPQLAGLRLRAEWGKVKGLALLGGPRRAWRRHFSRAAAAYLRVRYCASCRCKFGQR